MSRILCIETSTEVCSVAIAEDGKIIAFREDITGQNHSRLLTVYIAEIMEANQIKVQELDAVAVSEGPGSYTGLRIGVSAAKGLCFGGGIPLIAINPLEAMASMLINNPERFSLTTNAGDIFIPMIDARRMEVYAAVYNASGNEIAPVQAMVIQAGAFDPFGAGCNRYIFGNGAAKCLPVLGAGVTLVDNVIASSMNMVALAEKKLANKHVVDLAYFEPFYLKDFVATVPKNNVLNQ